MNLFVQRAVATLVLAAQAAGMGTGAAAQAAGVHADAAAPAAPAGAVVQTMGILHDSEPPVKPTPPTPPTPPAPSAWVAAYPPEPVFVPTPIPPTISHFEVLEWEGMTEEDRAEQQRWVEEQKAKFEAEERERVQRLEQEEYAQWKATVYAQWEAECQRINDEAAAKANAAYDAELARFDAAVTQYHAEYAQYQKDLAQWEIAYAQWEKEQGEAQRKPGVDVTTPAPDTDSGTKAPDVPDKGTDETEAPATLPELTPEQLAALQRMFGQNSSYASQLEALRRAQQQTQTVTQTPTPARFKNTGTEEQAARLQEFLDAYPQGTPWDDYTMYKTNYLGCAAYAFQAQHTVFGTDDQADYVWSDDIADIRQYSIVYYSGGSTTGHWVFILSVDEITSDAFGPVSVTVTVAEGNYNSHVCIGNTITLYRNMGEQVFFELYNYAK